MGEKMAINEVRFEVIGVTESKGGGGFGGPDLDSQVFLPASAVEGLLGVEKISSILVQVDEKRIFSRPNS